MDIIVVYSTSTGKGRVPVSIKTDIMNTEDYLELEKSLRESLSEPSLFIDNIIKLPFKEAMCKDEGPKKYRLIKSDGVVFGRPLGKRDMVFCIIYCDDAKPYINYDYFTKSSDPTLRAKADLTVPLVLAQMRWDGCLGFVGGNVEKHHDSLLDALKDELSEEIGLELSEKQLNDLEPFATYENEKGTIHISSFLLKVSEKEIREILGGAEKGRHYISENCGNVVLQIHESSVNNLLAQTFSGSGHLELEKLIKEKQLLEKSTGAKKDVKSF